MTSKNLARVFNFSYFPYDFLGYFKHMGFLVFMPSLDTCHFIIREFLTVFGSRYPSIMHGTHPLAGFYFHKILHRVMLSNITGVKYQSR